LIRLNISKIARGVKSNQRKLLGAHRSVVFLLHTSSNRLRSPPSFPYSEHSSSFPVIKRPVRGGDHPHPTSTEVTSDQNYIPTSALSVHAMQTRYLLRTIRASGHLMSQPLYPQFDHGENNPVPGEKSN
jgi:hypothetical protein